ncbi:MAG: hypothetical protein WC700_16340 [Gemmatimonadaceae bacterium]|jgi:hypothetical protein
MTFRERCALTALTEALRVSATWNASALAGAVWDVADAMADERARRDDPRPAMMTSVCEKCLKSFPSPGPTRFCGRECYNKGRMNRPVEGSDTKRPVSP